MERTCERCEKLFWLTFGAQRICDFCIAETAQLDDEEEEVQEDEEAER